MSKPRSRRYPARASDRSMRRSTPGRLQRKCSAFRPRSSFASSSAGCAWRRSATASRSNALMAWKSRALLMALRLYPRPPPLRYGMLCAMPELPEVERGRRIAMNVILGRRIAEIRCADDPIVFEGVSAARFRKALLGRRVLAVKRHGKHLWFELDRRPWPCLHFGMTGGFHTAPGGPRVKLKSSAKRPDQTWPPRFTKLQLVCDDGGELVVADARRLGRIRLRQDPAHEPPISLLGFDAHRALPPFAAFRD